MKHECLPHSHTWTTGNPLKQSELDSTDVLTAHSLFRRPCSVIAVSDPHARATAPFGVDEMKESSDCIPTCIRIEWSRSKAKATLRSISYSQSVRLHVHSHRGDTNLWGINLHFQPKHKVAHPSLGYCNGEHGLFHPFHCASLPFNKGTNKGNIFVIAE